MGKHCINVISSILLLTRDNQTDGQALVEDPDLIPGLEDPPGQPQLLEGEAGGQQEGRQEGPGDHGTADRTRRDKEKYYCRTPVSKIESGRM